LHEQLGVRLRDQRLRAVLTGDGIGFLRFDKDALLDRIRGRAEEAAKNGERIRKDDNPEVFRTRLEVYRAQTAPVTQYYRSQGLLGTVDGLQSIDVVTEELSAVLAKATLHRIGNKISDASNIGKHSSCNAHL